MPVFIFQEDALELMGQVEGAEWQNEQIHQSHRWTDCSFNEFKEKWLSLFETLKAKGFVTKAEEVPAHCEESGLDFGISVNGTSAIYGRGGWNRYTVRASGEIFFIVSKARSPESKETAQSVGFGMFG